MLGHFNARLVMRSAGHKEPLYGLLCGSLYIISSCHYRVNNNNFPCPRGPGLKSLMNKCKQTSKTLFLNILKKGLCFKLMWQLCESHGAFRMFIYHMHFVCMLQYRIVFPGHTRGLGVVWCIKIHAFTTMRGVILYHTHPQQQSYR